MKHKALKNKVLSGIVIFLYCVSILAILAAPAVIAWLIATSDLPFWFKFWILK